MNVVTVKINEMEYSLTGSEDVEYIKVLANYVNEKVSAIKNNNKKLGTSELSVLAAINIVDELIKLKTQKDKIDSMVSSLQENREELIKKNEQLLSILEKSQHAMENLQNSNGELDKLSNNLQHENEELKSQNVQIQEKNQQLEIFAKQLQHENQDLKVYIEDLEKAEGRDEESENQIETLIEENEALKKKLRSTLEQNKFMEQKTKKYVQEIKNLKNENKLYKKV